MTKKLLFSLLLCWLFSTAGIAQTQVIEQVAQLHGAASSVARSADVTQDSKASQDAETVKEFRAKIAQSNALHQPQTSPTANAGPEKHVNVESGKTWNLSGNKFAPGSWQVNNQNGAKRAARRKAATLPAEQSCAEFDYKYSDGSCSTNGVMKVKRIDDTNVQIINLWGLTDTLQATYDAAAGTLKITPAQIYQHSTYGPVWACSMDLAKRVYSTTTPITATVSDDGTITLGAWGVIVTEGDSKGGSFGVYSKSELKPCNATMSSVIYNGKSLTNTDSVQTYGVYVSQPYDNEIEIVNFVNNGATVKARLKPDSTVTISPQRIFTNMLYGPFNCYPADYAKSKYAQKGNIVAKGGETAIELGNWGVFCAASQSLSSLRVLSSKITFAKGAVTYPKPTPQDWAGNGTAASPYVITKPSQLEAFGEDVLGGNDYKGKYVKLGNDVDMSTSTKAYTSIGSLETPFRGTFDGDGKALKNLTISVGSDDYQGLFGYADTLSVIKNLTLDNVKMESAGRYSGPVAGWSAGKLTDIKVTGATLAFTNYSAGGVVGYFCGPELKNVYFKGAITGAGEDGGIAGNVVGSAVASNLEAHGSITMSSLANSVWKSIGGVVASTLPAKDKEPLVRNSYNDMQLTDKTGYAYIGGVVGEVLTGTVERCYNAGPISGAANYTSSKNNGASGGVAGSVYGGNLKDCYNSNIVLNSSPSLHVGGVVGYVPTPSYTMNSDGDTIEWNYLSTVVRCINFGQVRVPATVINETEGVYGAAYSDTIMKDVYFDQQMVGTIMPASVKRMVLTTAQLTSGKALAGYDTSVWNFTEGLYPRLKGLEATTTAYLGAAPITFKEGSDVTKVKRNFKISTANDVYWKLYDNSNFTDETAGLKIEGDSVVVKNAYSSELLVALSKTNTSILKLYSLSTINPSLFAGQGTEKDPYLIRNKADLESLGDGISKYAQTFKGDYFKQTADVDATGFGGIGMGGNSALQFNGTYDGDGHAIHNLKIDGVAFDADGKPDTKTSKIAVSLFGFVGEKGTIKNLSIASDCELRALNYASGVAAVNYGKVFNCKNYAKITTTDKYAAGIVALNQGGATVEQCYNAGHIVTGGSYAAGIAAYSLGTVRNSQNDGYILGDSITPGRKAGAQTYVAGIVATTGAESVIENNVNTGAIYASYTVGGVSTQAASRGSFTGNINYGTVERSKATDANRGALLSHVPGQTCKVAANYYDVQIGHYGAAASTIAENLNGVNTSVLTSGEALDGIDADLYDWSKGLYPVIKAFKDEPAAIANRKMVVTFADGQTADDVYGTAALYKASDLKWSLTGGKHFSVADGALKVDLAADTTSLRDSLVAKVGDYEKVIALRAMPSVFDGAGTKADPFQIKSKDDMLKLAKFANDELFAFTGRYFKVLNDIDFGETEYKSVGVDAGSFNADFDGNGKKFSNINNTFALTQASRGLFGTVGPKGAVHDLTLVSGKITGYRYNGGVAGNVYGKVYNCENHAVVSTSNLGVGGIAGIVKIGGEVYNCKNYGSFETKSGGIGGIAYQVDKGGVVRDCENDTALSTPKSTLGGIAANSGGVIRNCVNKGQLDGASTIAGILASSMGGDSIVDCHNEGEIISSGSYVAGIVGTGKKSVVPMVVKNCYNVAPLTGKGYLGGVAGRLYAGAVLEDCYNTADLTSISSTDVGGVAGAQGGSRDCTSKMIRCYNTGAVVSHGQYTGGVIGDNDDDTYVEACYNTGDVLADANFSGGFAGGFSGVAVDCYNTGNVEASGYGIGGFSGLGPGEIHGCFNLGNVTSTGGTNTFGVAGGLWGYGRPRLYDSYNMGTVTGKTHVGGIAAGAFDDFTLVNVYNAGKIVTSDTTASGNICPSAPKYDLYFTNVYYDTDVNPGFTPSQSDAMANGVTTRNLALAALGDSAYAAKSGMYPTLKAQAQNELANWFAAVPVLAAGDTYGAVTSAFVIGTPDGTVWTASDNLTITDGNVTSSGVGAAWLTKTYGDHKKTYDLHITKVSGVDGLNADAAIVKTEYYSVSGVALGQQKPAETGVYVAKDYYSNGKSAAHKIVVK